MYLIYYQVMVNLENAPLDDEPHWYALRSHNKQIPLPLASPIPARHQMKHSRRNSDNGSREQLSSPASGGRISDSEFSDYDDGIGVVTGKTVNQSAQDFFLI